MAARDHPGGPWERQGGHEVVNDRIFVDFGMISGLVYVSLWGSKCLNIRFIFRLVSRELFYRFLTRFSTFGNSKSWLSHGKYCKNRLVMEINFNEFRDRFQHVF